MEPLADGDLGYPWKLEVMQWRQANGPNFIDRLEVVPDEFLAWPFQKLNLEA